MQWDDLRFYLAAVRAGSYTAAGRRLGVNRTTIGRRVEALERTLGVPVFHETPLGPEPTAQGAILLEAAARIEAEIDAMQTRIAPGVDRPDILRIAGSAGIAAEFAGELHAFRSVMPGVSIELLGELDPVAAVTYRRADLGIAMMRKPPTRLAGVEIARLPQACYGLRGAKHLNQLGWGHEIDTALPGQWINSNPAGTEAEAMRLTTFNSWPQMKEAVLSGFGKAKLWCFVGDAQATLERLDDPDPRDEYPLWLIHRAKAPPSPALSGLMAFLQERLEKRLEPAANSHANP